MDENEKVYTHQAQVHKIKEVHRRRADEAGDEQVGRAVVELERRADLLDDAVVHDDDPVGHGHGFDLVVGDVDGGGLQPLVQLLDLGAHLPRAAWRRGWRAARRTGTPADRARWRGPWRRAGAGRRTAGAASARAVGSSPRICGRAFDPLGDLGLGTRRELEREAHVLAPPSCADRARSSGTPWRCRDPSAAGR